MSEEIKSLVERARHNAAVFIQRAERDDLLEGCTNRKSEAAAWRQTAKTLTELADALEALAR